MPRYGETEPRKLFSNEEGAFAQAAGSFRMVQPTAPLVPSLLYEDDMRCHGEISAI